MNALAERKRLLIAKADLHRQLLGLERRRLGRRAAAVRGFAGYHRWWVFGGLLVAGFLLARRWRGLTRWLPAAATAWRIARNLRGD